MDRNWLGYLLYSDFYVLDKVWISSDRQAQKKTKCIDHEAILWFPA